MEAIAQAAALRQHLIDQGPVGFSGDGEALLQAFEDMLGAGDDGVDP